MKIGIFDSGIGGLDILREIVYHLAIPNLEIFYLTDYKYFPYGKQSEEVIKKRSHLLCKILIKENVDIILVACNTATAIAINSLRQFYQVPFVGIEPFLNFKHNLFKNLVNSKIAVLITPSTFNSKRFKNLKDSSDPNNKFHIFPCKNLAKIVEDIYKFGLKKTSKLDLENELYPLKDMGFSHIVLGCTHYPLIKKHIEQYLYTKCISPSQFIVQRIKSLLPIKKSEFTINNKKNINNLKYYYQKDASNNIWDIRRILELPNSFH